MMRNIIHIDKDKCDGCALCCDACVEGAIAIVDGKAKHVSEVYCDGLGACIGECPHGAITIEQKEARAFDEEAVKKHLQAEKDAPSQKALAGQDMHAEVTEQSADPPHRPVKIPHACPGAALRVFRRPQEQARNAVEQEQPSALGQWPIQLMLVPSHAPFLKGADLLICADCIPFVVPDFHQRYLAGRAIVVGCPKLDDLNYYREKLQEMLDQAQPRSLTVLRMEVPCCSGIAHATVEARDKVLPDVPVEIHTVGIQGEVDIESVPAKAHASELAAR